MTGDKVRELLKHAGQTYAEEAGIRLADKPAPLYQLLVLTVLLSIRIKADLAVAAARELFGSGWTTPKKMRQATWRERVHALGRAHYVRYDESTSTRLASGAQMVLDVYDGDLRKMREAAGGDVRELRRLLKKMPRIGDVGADIFCREVQAVWPEVQPYFDKRALEAAARLGLPRDPEKLAKLVDDSEIASLAAALVRTTLDKHLSEELKIAS
ncbi:endonuclease [Longimycelium tulufanense]|uniref:Endonuclease n=1 Tax=Longimycelium tulufanense TaxID=907463 RepID=A0A8J3CB96_9PSEU|nr:endonuclease [Longimycelium tulufanense]GGM47946.1 endonuclease [Longimycelium tulufanense]